MSRPAPHAFEIGGQPIGNGPLFFLAGPCVLQSRQLALDIAGTLRDLMSERGLPFIFKASFDKANRSSIGGGRGPGMDEGLKWLSEIKAEIGVPVVTDVHLPEQCAAVAEVVDLLQIPAFLCRQTDLLVAAARTGKPVNVKKGQFLAPWDMANVVKKITDSGGPAAMVTERGTSFGYGRLVVDMRRPARPRRDGSPRHLRRHPQRPASRRPRRPNRRRPHPGPATRPRGASPRARSTGSSWRRTPTLTAPLRMGRTWCCSITCPRCSTSSWPSTRPSERPRLRPQRRPRSVPSRPSTGVHPRRVSRVGTTSSDPTRSLRVPGETPAPMKTSGTRRS